MDYYPTIDELVYLFAFVSLLLLVGKFIKIIFVQKRESPKISIIVVLWLTLLIVYMLFSGYMYLRAEPSHRITILGWCLLFWIIPLFYYSFLFLNAVSSRIMEQISPVGAKIEDPSPFASARKLALLGDIDGAIELYRSYKTHQVEALFEAFRLLKSKGRYEDAFNILQEIIDKYPDRSDAWVEAKYYQAKIKANIYQQFSEAIQIYKQILKKRTKTPFHSIAVNEIARLQAIQKTSGVVEEFVKSDIEETQPEEKLEQVEETHLGRMSKDEKKRYLLAIEDTLFGTYVPPDPFYKGKDDNKDKLDTVEIDKKKKVKQKVSKQKHAKSKAVSNKNEEKNKKTPSQKNLSKKSTKKKSEKL